MHGQANSERATAQLRGCLADMGLCMTLAVSADVPMSRPVTVRGGGDAKDKGRLGSADLQDRRPGMNVGV